MTYKFNAPMMSYW